MNPSATSKRIVGLQLDKGLVDDIVKALTESDGDLEEAMRSQGFVNDEEYGDLET